MQLDECAYELPAELIAQQPVKARDRARLLILDRARQVLTHAHVRDLATILTPQDMLVINETKVFPARLLGQRHESGGRVEILLVRREGPRRLQGLVGPSHRVFVGPQGLFSESDWMAGIGES